MYLFLLFSFQVFFLVYFITKKQRAALFFIGWLAAIFLSIIYTYMLVGMECIASRSIPLLKSSILYLVLLDASLTDAQLRIVNHTNLFAITITGILGDSKSSLIWGGGFFILFIILLAFRICPLPGGDMKFLSSVFFYFQNSNAFLFFFITLVIIMMHMLLMKLRKKELPKTIAFIPYAAVGVLIVNTVTLFNSITIL